MDNPRNTYLYTPPTLGHVGPIQTYLTKPPFALITVAMFEKCEGSFYSNIYWLHIYITMHVTCRQKCSVKTIAKCTCEAQLERTKYMQVTCKSHASHMQNLETRRSLFPLWLVATTLQCSYSSSNDTSTGVSSDVNTATWPA